MFSSVFGLWTSSTRYFSFESFWRNFCSNLSLMKLAPSNRPSRSQCCRLGPWIDSLSGAMTSSANRTGSPFTHLYVTASTVPPPASRTTAISFVCGISSAIRSLIIGEAYINVTSRLRKDALSGSLWFRNHKQVTNIISGTFAETDVFYSLF